jgi:TatD DNase family protein
LRGSCFSDKEVLEVLPVNFEDLTPCHFIDSHCHLNMDAYSGDLDDVLNRAMLAGIDRIITIGIDLPSSEKAIMLASRYPQISATIGVHPHDVDSLRERDYARLERLYSDNRDSVVGFGEIGLDYYKNYADPANQRKHFRRQLELAHELKLPVIIHNRNADEDILAILRQIPLDYGGVMHCFSGDVTFARKVIDLGMRISIPGVVTFKNSHVLQEVVEKTPLTSMLIETDGPFLAPHPYRGKRNEPSYLVYTAQKIAELQETPLAAVAEQTSANAKDTFKLLH